MAIKWYVREALDPLASVTPLCSLVGIAAASLYVKVSIPDAVMLLVAMLFANIAVNIMNDYTDFSSGLDKEAVKTKFSGGRSGLIVRGLVKPRRALAMALGAALLTLIIGIRFLLAQPVLIPLALFGGVVIFFYTSHFVNVPFLSEILLVITYSLVPLGSFIAMTGSLAHLQSALVVSVPVGVTVGMVLLINEIPDREVDRKHGRRSAAVIINKPRGIAYYYLAWQTAGVLILIYGVVAGAVPATALSALIALPLMLFVFRGAGRYRSAASFEKYMGIDVAYFLLFVLLLSAGLLIR